MKILSNLIFIYIYLLEISSTSPYNAPISSSNFSPYCYNTLINDYYFQSDKLENENLTKAKKFLAPSYFTLVIKEIIPSSIKLEDYISRVTCLSKYFNESNQKKVIDLVKYSAKSFPDFGEEDGCIRNNNSFILFTIKYDYHKKEKYTGKFRLLPFIANGYSFFGLCVDNNNECTDNLTDTIKGIINQFKGNLTLNGLDEFNFSTFIHYPKNSSQNQKDIFEKTSFHVFYGLYLIFFIVRIIIWIIGGRFFKEKDDITNKKRSRDDSDSSEEEEEEGEEEEDETNTHTHDKGVDKQKQIELIDKKYKELDVPKRKLYPKFYMLYRFSSISHGVNILTQKDLNPYYNESGLHFILFFRFLSLLFKVLHMNLDFVAHNPSREINNTTLFDRSIVVIIKLSSFSDVGIIITESILVSYKLMSFIRKYTKKNEEPSFKLFLNFFLRIIPSMTTIFHLFVVFYLFSSSLINFLHFSVNGTQENIYNTKIRHIFNNIMDCNGCVKDWKYLIPFYMQYANYNAHNGIDENCFQFMIVMVNLFYCYCICLLLTFISFKIKNKIFDITLSIIFLVNFLIPNDVSCESFLDSHNFFNINLLFGETCSLTKTHLFINYYFFGFLIGFILFYNNDITKENSLQNSNIYKPFDYLKKLNQCFFKSPIWVHILIITITVLVQLALCFSFLTYTHNGIKYEDLAELNGFDKFIYLNEKTIYSLAFGFFVTHLYTYKEESKLKEFGNDIIIIMANRIGYGFYAIMEVIINTMYSTFDLNYNISGQNLLFSSYSIIFFMLITNLFLFLMYELPIKMLTKKVLQIEKVK